MNKYPIGYVATVFFYGETTRYKYAGNGEWECISGCNSPARYQQLLDMVK
jgi:hypothetical protein